MKIYSLFQTDQWESKNSRIFFGNFSSYEKALEAGKKNGLEEGDSEKIVIIETELDVFEEL